MTDINIKRHCCFIPCEQDARFQICNTGAGATPDDWTDACTLHLFELMNDDWREMELIEIMPVGEVALQYRLIDLRERDDDVH